MICAARGSTWVPNATQMLNGMEEHLEGKGLQGHKRWWKLCSMTNSTPLPPPALPAALKDASPAVAQCSPAAVTAAVRRRRAPGRSVLLRVAGRPLDQVRGSSGYPRLALAATALYALLHGYPCVYYDGTDACRSTPSVPADWPPLQSAGQLRACQKRQCCWQGGYWLRAEWLKPAALIDAARRYPDAAWLVMLDTDALPQFAGWSVDQAAAWSMQNTLRDGAGWHIQEVSQADPEEVVAIVGREAYAGLYAEGGPAQQEVARSKRFNTGVMLVRGGERGREFSSRWWATRDSDCLAQCKESERLCSRTCLIRGGGMWACQRRGMYRLWEQADQSAFGHWLHAALPPGQLAEVPAVTLNTHSGTFFAHFDNERARQGSVVDLWAMEHVARFAAVASQAVCAPKAVPECAKLQQYNGDLSALQCIRSGWADGWAAEALKWVESVQLRWGNDTAIDRRCYGDLQDMVTAELASTKRRGRRR
eukprot:TRINITY_DN4914_c0_g3_i2.p1 TRINITY_DN4914_c0_g3~~TRINITY_DN4914_c0_g3_i2.p1  ORF type:complete len:479 (+),score=172.80 TRINITY_DN4914_c0_g3_i2:277-1713(+)